MDFFKSLTLDLQMLVVAIAGFALLAMFSGNHKSERRYMLVLAVLAAVGVYRFTHVGAEEQVAKHAVQSSIPAPVTAPPKKVRITSTAAKE